MEQKIENKEEMNQKADVVVETMKNKKINRITIYMLLIIVLTPLVSSLNYYTVNDVFGNFSNMYNSEGVYNNGSTIIGTINGSIDEVMIFNTVLNSSQISAIYNNQSQRFKVNGTQTFNFNLTSEYNWIQVTENKQQFFGSSIFKRLGGWDVSLGYNNSDFIIPSGLVSYYHLDSNNGTLNYTKDFVGSYNGQCSGTNCIFTQGVYNNSANFNGINNTITASPTINGITNGSAFVWIKPTFQGNNEQHIVDVGNNQFYFYITNGGIYTNPAGVVCSINLNTNSIWQYIGYTWTSSPTNNMTIYLNGIPCGSGTTLPTPTSNSIAIGNYYGGGNYRFNGSMDEVMIFNRSLTQAEISELYVKGRANWNYTAYQTSDMFNINKSRTNWLLDYLLSAGNATNPFYSPVLGSGIGLNNVTLITQGLVNTCGIIDSPGTYTLNQSITGTGTCFTITASNVVLDGNGYNITYGTDGTTSFIYGVYTSGYSNLTIKNANIYEASGGSSKFAVYLISSNYSIIQNNNITTVGDFGHGIYLSSSSSSNIISNKISTSGVSLNAGSGIYLSSSSNSNNITSNIISTNASYGTGIWLSTSSNSNIISNNITVTCVLSATGIVLSSSSNSTNITSNIITTTGASAYGIDIKSSYSSLNTVALNNITTTGPVANGIYLRTSTISNNIISNIITTTGNNANGIALSTNSKHHIISSNILNISDGDRISITGATSINNTFINNSIVNRNYSWYDIKFATASINGTWFIDQYLENYIFTGSGGTINVQDSKFGQIMFISAINGTGTNFSNNIKIGNNFVYVNSSQTGLNKSANVTLYNIPTLLIPYIQYNGISVCNSTTSPSCFNFTALNGDVKFNVSSWSNYSIYSDTIIPNEDTVIANPSGGVGATYIFENVTALDLYNITLEYNNTMYLNQLYSIYIKTYNSSGELTDINSINIITDNSSLNTYETIRLNKGYYKINIQPVLLGEFNGVITVRQSMKNIDRSIHFKVIDESNFSIESIKATIKSFGDNLNEFISKNIFYIIVVSLLLAILFIICYFFYFFYKKIK